MSCSTIEAANIIIYVSQSNRINIIIYGYSKEYASLTGYTAYHCTILYYPVIITVEGFAFQVSFNLNGIKRKSASELLILCGLWR